MVFPGLFLRSTVLKSEAEFFMQKFLLHVDQNVYPFTKWKTQSKITKWQLLHDGNGSIDSNQPLKDRTTYGSWDKNGSVL